MTMPAPAAIVAGPPLFVTMSTVLLQPGTTVYALAFDTDQAVQLQMAWQRVDPPADPGALPLSGTATDAAATTHHVLQTQVSPGSLLAGQMVLMTVSVAPTDTTGLIMRPYVTQQRTINNRMPAPVAGRSVPVRFYNFGGTPPPPAGGGVPPAAGNWNTYRWAQYNPKGTNFPT